MAPSLAQYAEQLADVLVATPATGHPQRCRPPFLLQQLGLDMSECKWHRFGRAVHGASCQRTAGRCMAGQHCCRHPGGQRNGSTGRPLDERRPEAYSRIRCVNVKRGGGAQHAGRTSAVSGAAAGAGDAAHFARAGNRVQQQAERLPSIPARRSHCCAVDIYRGSSTFEAGVRSAGQQQRQQQVASHVADRGVVQGQHRSIWPGRTCRHPRHASVELHGEADQQGGVRMPGCMPVRMRPERHPACQHTHYQPHNGGWHNQLGKPRATDGPCKPCQESANGTSWRATVAASAPAAAPAYRRR
mmetsp:Transcript_1013/g.2744  ORF Transcript_1013/g.2744 Transcript_1013/m.2744 type:complete len:301 (-) Transcript_1013:1072-1974(-)